MNALQWQMGAIRQQKHLSGGTPTFFIIGSLQALSVPAFMAKKLLRRNSIAVGCINCVYYNIKRCHLFNGYKCAGYNTVCLQNGTCMPNNVYL